MKNKFNLSFSYFGEHKVKKITKPIHVKCRKTVAETTKTEMGKKIVSPAKPSIAVPPYLPS